MADISTCDIRMLEQDGGRQHRDADAQHAAAPPGQGAIPLQQHRGEDAGEEKEGGHAECMAEL
ncbi:hypothetical protein [Teichococcus vastitatis]|uniref:Uncharacterized protein n=1 Tax=Teichococcus vastitatis TaxID=2307076 RepID=A0ABS9W7G9_9PROT|nr:hypothetical protein [Pseudoroseomonas vastitatis]MCI0754725.1 hypothetical protein [Pseudoroseomonas vastitatis]